MSSRLHVQVPVAETVARSTEQTQPSEETVVRAMPGLLTTRDLTILFVVILFFVTNDSNAVAGGPAGLTLWMLGGLLFFLPCVVATAQLGVLFPHEGALYCWTHHTLGGFWTFLVGFAAWMPGALLVLATADLLISMFQGLNPKWLQQPWQQGAVLLLIIIASGIIAVQRQRMVQNLINMVFVLLMLGAALVSVSGLAWLLAGHLSATNFSHLAAWNPFMSANYPLFGVITLGYLGVNLPLNMAGEFVTRQEPARSKSIKDHVLLGLLIVLVGYLFSTFSILVVQGQNASFVLFAPVNTVDMALGKVAGDVTAICIMATLFIATVAYNSVFARFLLVGGIDQRIPMNWGKLNRNRAPANAIVLQTAIACVLTILFFIVGPYIGILAGPPAHLAAVFYFVSVGTATLLWAFATNFLFIDLLWLLFYKRKTLSAQQLAPSWVLCLCAIVGLCTGLIAIVDTLFNSYDPPDIGNTSWFIAVVGLSVAFLGAGTISAMVANSEARWQADSLSSSNTVLPENSVKLMEAAQYPYNRPIDKY